MDKYKSIKRACEINDTIFKEIIANFAFKTEKEVELYILERFRDFKVKKAYKPIVANNSAVIHAKPRKKRFEKGFCILDFAAKVNNYCSDMTRTIHIGKANADERKMYNLVLRCQQKCLSKVREGVDCCDLDIYARTLLGKYKKFFGHALGHGVGRKVHTNPKISPTSQDVLAKGEFITIEPGVYIKEKKLGIRIEDTVYVSINHEVLSRSPKRLIEV